MSRFISILIVCAFIMPLIARADFVSRSFESNAVDVSAVVPGTEGMTEMEVVSTLRHDIELLDEEIRTCERKKKGWVAATVAGGVGVVGTGIGMLVQNSKIQDTKSNIERVNADIKSTQDEIEKLKK